MTEITSIPNGNPENPVSEVSPKSLDVLFNMDPLQYTEQDISDIVKALRDKAAQWKQEEAAGKTKSSKAKMLPAPKEFTLKDLDL